MCITQSLFFNIVCLYLMVSTLQTQVQKEQKHDAVSGVEFFS